MCGPMKVHDVWNPQWQMRSLVLIIVPVIVCYAIPFHSVKSMIHGIDYTESVNLISTLARMTSPLNGFPTGTTLYAGMQEKGCSKV